MPPNSPKPLLHLNLPVLNLKGFDSADPCIFALLLLEPLDVLASRTQSKRSKRLPYAIALVNLKCL